MALTAIDPDTGMPHLPPNQLWRVNKVANMLRNTDAYSGYEEGTPLLMRVTLIERVSKVRKIRRPWKATIEEVYTAEEVLGSSTATIKDHPVDMQRELQNAAHRVLSDIEARLKERAGLAAKLDLVEKLAGDYPPKKLG